MVSFQTSYWGIPPWKPSNLIYKSFQVPPFLLIYKGIPKDLWERCQDVESLCVQWNAAMLNSYHGPCRVCSSRMPLYWCYNIESSGLVSWTFQFREFDLVQATDSTSNLVVFFKLIKCFVWCFIIPNVWELWILKVLLDWLCFLRVWGIFRRLSFMSATRIWSRV